MVFFFFLLSSRLWMDNHLILLIYKNFNNIFVNVKTKNFTIHSFIRSFIHSSIHSTNTACTKFYLLSHAQGVKKQFSARAHYHILFSILSFLPALISSVQNSILLASLPLSGVLPAFLCFSLHQNSLAWVLFRHDHQLPCSYLPMQIRFCQISPFTLLMVESSITIILLSLNVSPQCSS